jgi:WD40 repeat protein
MTGKVEAELKGHTDSVTSVAFSQDGSQVVSGSEDKRSEFGM